MNGKVRLARYTSTSMSYLTDGVHLYELLGSCKNFGMAGGAWLTVRDCLTETVRTLSELELALCEPVAGPPTLAS